MSSCIHCDVHIMQGNRPSIGRILWNVCGAVGFVTALNAVIFALGLSELDAENRGRLFEPIPGAFIGGVWTVLFALMGFARGRLVAQTGRAAREAALSITLLIVACAVYPIYTLGFRNEQLGLAGNLATIALSVWVTRRVALADRITAIAPVAVIAWVCFATVYLADQQRWFW